MTGRNTSGARRLSPLRRDLDACERWRLIQRGLIREGAGRPRADAAGVYAAREGAVARPARQGGGRARRSRIDLQRRLRGALVEMSIVALTGAVQPSPHHRCLFCRKPVVRKHRHSATYRAKVNDVAQRRLFAHSRHREASPEDDDRASGVISPSIARHRPTARARAHDRASGSCPALDRSPAACSPRESPRWSRSATRQAALRASPASGA
jgi:hypothetical protein